MSAAAAIVAPTDAQLDYIAGLCAERGIEPMPVVYSKDDGRLDGPAKPHPKAAATKAGRQRRYRRTVASPKQWQAIMAAKIGPCRVCCDPASNGSKFSRIQLHHVVSRQDGGDDVADNCVPLCPECHDKVTRRAWLESRELLETLTDAEYAYMIQRGGENYPERAYGIIYDRSGDNA